MATASGGTWVQNSNNPNDWSYKGANGSNVTNMWAKDSQGKYYYLDGNGKMAVNTTTADGYKVGADGAWDGGAQVLPQQQQAQPQQPNIQDMINNEYTQALAARTAAINKARDTAINGYNQQIQGADSQYQPLRNDASYQGSRSLQGLKETMAKQGLFNSGDNVTGQAQINNNTAKNINSLNSQQQDYVNKLNQAITQAKANAEYDVANATADTMAQKLNALVNQSNTDRTFNYQVGRDNIADTGKLADGTYTLAGQQALNSIKNGDLQNQLATLQLKYQPQIYQGQIDGQTLQNEYQKLVNAGVPAEQAADLAYKAAQTANLNKSTSLMGLKSSGSGGGGSMSSTLKSQINNIDDLVNGNENLSVKQRTLSNLISTLNNASGSEAQALQQYAQNALGKVNNQMEDYVNNGRYSDISQANLNRR